MLLFFHAPYEQLPLVHQLVQTLGILPYLALVVGDIPLKTQTDCFGGQPVDCLPVGCLPVECLLLECLPVERELQVECFMVDSPL